MKISRWLIAASLLSGTLTFAQITNYYVAPSPTGSDARTATQAQSQATPWATIQHAIVTASIGAGGTIIHVANGTYSDTSGCFSSAACFTRGGTSTTARLVLQCDNGAASFTAAQGKCNIRTTVWFNGTSGVNNIDLIGFDIGNLPNNNNAIAAANNGTASTYNSLHIINNWVHDVGQNIVFNSITGCTNDGMIVLGPPHGSAFSNTDLQVIGNRVMNYGIVGNGCTNGHGIYIGSANSIIQNNVISGITTSAVETYDQPCNHRIVNNTMFNSGRGVQQAGGSCSGGGNTINNNVLDGVVRGVMLGTGTGTSCILGTTKTMMFNNMLSGNTTNFLIGGASNPANTACETFSGNITSETPANTFVNYLVNGTGDYHLKSTSLAKGGGTTTCVSGGPTPCAPVTDADGVTRPSPPSISAFDIATVVPAPHLVPPVPSPVNCGSSIVGVAVNCPSVTIQNTGSASLTVTARTTTAPFSTVANGTCGALPITVAAGSSCTFIPAFNPTAVGLVSGTITLTSNDPSSPTVVNISGTGTLPDASLTSLNGGAPISTSGIDDAGDWGTLSCPEPSPLPNTIAGSWSIKHDIGTSGTSCGNTSLAGSPSQDGQSRRFDISWTALGGERASIFFNPSFLDTGSRTYVIDTFAYFSDLTHVNDIEIDMNQVMANGQTVIYGIQANFVAGFWQYTTASSPTTSQWNNSTIAVTRANFNTGSTPNHIILTSHRDINGILTYDSVNLNGVTTAFAGATGNSAFTLGWTPIGSNVMNFQIDGDNSANSMSAYLDKTTILASGASLGFGNVSLNATSPVLTAALLASGTAPLTISSISVATPFTITTHNCPLSPSTLAPGNSCQISVTATPTAATSVVGSLTVASNASSGAQSIPLLVTGQPLPVPGTGVVIQGPIIISGGVQFNPN